MGGDCATIDEVVARMAALARELPVSHGHDHGATLFNEVYLRVTERVRDALRTPGWFADPAGMEALDVTFANRYFAALDAIEAGAPPTGAWGPLFRRSDDRRVLRAQFAVAGMNAHIVQDLPIALCERWVIAGRPARRGPAHADYVKINALLVSEVADARRRCGLPRWLGRGLVGRADSALAVWLIARARALAWYVAGGLYADRGDRAAERRRVARLRDRSAWLSRLLLIAL